MIDQVDLACGYCARRPGGWSLKKLGYRLFLKRIFGLRVKGIDCAFNLFRRSVFDRLPIQSDGAFVHAEILAKANFLGCLMAEVAVSCKPVAGSGGWPAIPGQRRKEAFVVFQDPDFGPVSVASSGQAVPSGQGDG
jgi:hypothetical protein